MFLSSHTKIQPGLIINYLFLTPGIAVKFYKTSRKWKILKKKWEPTVNTTLPFIARPKSSQEDTPQIKYLVTTQALQEVPDRTANKHFGKTDPLVRKGFRAQWLVYTTRSLVQRYGVRI